MPERSKGMIALGAAVALWGLSPLFIAHLRAFYHPHTQNFFRYLAASVCLVALCAARRAPVFPSRRAMLLLLVPLVPNVLFQTFNVFALYRAQPAIVALVGKMSVVFATVLAFALFREERGHIRSPRFIIGTVLALGGVAGLYAFKIGKPDPRFTAGVLFALVGAVGWGGYIVAVKFAVRRVPPLTSWTVVSLYTTVALAFFAFLAERPLTDVHDTGVGPNVVLVVSGVLCIGLAHVCYYRAIQRLGAAVCATALLASPVITSTLSRLLFDERLSIRQVLCAALLLLGAFLALLARPATKAPPSVTRVTEQNTPDETLPPPSDHPKKP